MKKRPIVAGQEEAPVVVGREEERPPPVSSPAPCGLTHMAVAGFLKLRGLKVPAAQLSGAGKQISAICRQRKIEIRQVEDARYGTVNAYPIAILEEFFRV
jgi:hypothetical protein